MTMNELQRLARTAGFQYLRGAKGRHELWKHPATGKTVMLSPSNSYRKKAKFEADLRRAAQP